MRWVVEAVNGRLKNVFKFFKHMIEGGYTPKIMRFVKIACAILNKYFPPLVQPTDFHDLITEKIASHSANTNALKEEVERLGLRRMTPSWRKATPSSVPDFPQLSWQDLKEITLGTFQLKMAKLYNADHLKAGDEFGIFLHRATTQILRVQIRSRFRRSHSYPVWVRYSPRVNGVAGIEGVYCGCKVGERNLGCCSHCTSVNIYLSLLLQSINVYQELLFMYILSTFYFSVLRYFST